MRPFPLKQHSFDLLGDRSPADTGVFRTRAVPSVEAFALNSLEIAVPRWRRVQLTDLLWTYRVRLL